MPKSRSFVYFLLGLETGSTGSRFWTSVPCLVCDCLKLTLALDWQTSREESNHCKGDAYSGS